ncbi:hypothetical protein ACFPRL_19675 [Pseudoclavibacter helvolus]
MRRRRKRWRWRVRRPRLACHADRRVGNSCERQEHAHQRLRGRAPRVHGLA